MTTEISRRNPRQTADGGESALDVSVGAPRTAPENALQSSLSPAIAPSMSSEQEWRSIADHEAGHVAAAIILNPFDDHPAVVYAELVRGERKAEYGLSSIGEVFNGITVRPLKPEDSLRLDDHPVSVLRGEAILTLAGLCAEDRSLRMRGKTGILDMLELMHDGDVEASGALAFIIAKKTTRAAFRSMERHVALKAHSEWHQLLEQAMKFVNDHWGFIEGIGTRIMEGERVQWQELCAIAKLHGVEAPVAQASDKDSVEVVAMHGLDLRVRPRTAE